MNSTFRMITVGLVLLLASRAAGYDLAAFPLKVAEFHGNEHRTLYEKYSAASFKSLVDYEVKRKQLQESAYAAAKKVAAAYQAGGEIDLFVRADALAKALAPTADTVMALPPAPDDPDDVGKLKTVWAEQTGKLLSAEVSRQESLARQYALELEPISKALLKANKPDAAKALFEESKRLQRIFQESGSVASDVSDGVEGHFYVQKLLIPWKLYVNGKEIALVASDAEIEPKKGGVVKTEKVTLKPDDICVITYDSTSGRAIRVAFVSSDFKRAIHLTAKDYKLLGDGSPRTVGTRDLENATMGVRGGVDMGEVLEQHWLDMGMVSPKRGGSDWAMRDDRGKFLLAFQAKAEMFEDFER